jgi:ABC-type transport system involved in cytochrome c biogenesis permease subunit
MPLLTDRQEPEDYDRPSSDEPNDYAIRYLFNPNQPGVEYERTGRVLFYSSAATNLLALGLYAAWLEFSFVPWLLLSAILVTVLGGVASYYLYHRRRSRAYLVAFSPILLTVGVLLYLAFNPQNDQAGYFTFFLPGSLVLAASVFLLRLAKRPGRKLNS